MDTKVARRISVFKRVSGPEKVVCVYWRAGKCTRNPCRFLHSELPQSQPAKLAKDVHVNTWKRVPTTFSNKVSVSSEFTRPEYIRDAGYEDNWRGKVQEKRKQKFLQAALGSLHQPKESQDHRSKILRRSHNYPASDLLPASLETGSECKKALENGKQSSDLPAESLSSQQAKQSQVQHPKLQQKSHSDCVSTSSIPSVERGSVNNCPVQAQAMVCKDWLLGNCVHGQKCELLHSWFSGSGFSMLAKLDGHSEIVTGIALPASSDKLYSGGKDKTLRVWDCNSGQCVQVVNLLGEVGSLLSEGPWLFAGLPNAVKGWNSHTLTELTLTGPVGQVYAMAEGNDLLFAGTEDGTLLAWRFSSLNDVPELVASMKGHSGAVVSLMASLVTGANRLYSGSVDNTIRVWDLDTFKCIQTLQGHTGVVTSVIGWESYLLSCSLDGTIKVWATSESGDIEVVYTHNDKHGFTALCGISDAEAKPILLSSSCDNSLRLYDLPTFTERGRLFSKQEVRSIEIGPAGLFFTGDASGQLTVWKLAGYSSEAAVAS